MAASPAHLDKMVPRVGGASRSGGVFCSRGLVAALLEGVARLTKVDRRRLVVARRLVAALSGGDVAQCEGGRLVNRGVDRGVGRLRAGSRGGRR